MQGECDGLVLQHQARMLGAGLRQLPFDRAENVRIEGQVLHLPCGGPALGAVHAGRRQVQRGEQGVELAEWPSGNHSDGNVTDVQVLQGREGARGYGYQFRTGLDFCQRTVDVEEKSAAPDL